MFDYSHKQSNPFVKKPPNCPLCGAWFKDKGFIILYLPNKRKIKCLKCDNSFKEGFDAETMYR
jgi:hypothetical protein